MKIKIIYEDKDLLVAEKPAGLITFRENQEEGYFLMEYLINQKPELKKVGSEPRYGAIHRLDKETSGIVLIAKNNESFIYFQNEFKERRVKKEYIALCVGSIKEEKTIETYIGRSSKDRRKQKAFPLYNAKNPRLAVTTFKVLKNFENYTLIKAIPKTGRKHQIRCHLAHIKHPLAGDKMYSFKNQISPEGLERHFLHAELIKVKTLNNELKEFKSELPDDLKKTLEKIK
jgi:23S rRNA pseudouridine1911/1915/1917 synthase